MRSPLFIPTVRVPKGTRADKLWFVFQNQKLILRRSHDGTPQPFLSGLIGFNITPADQLFFGILDGQPCFAAVLDPGETLPSGYEAVDLRQLFGVVSDSYLSIVGRARQWIHWLQMHRFCGRCGQPTQDHHTEKAKVCPHCDYLYYPKITPAIIVAVVKSDRILLARSARFRNSFYSVLAGFVEPGETLESAVHREIYEEVRLQVDHIRYFGSQPWPFPSSMMIAFTAHYASGDIVIDDDEIVEAGWFQAGRLPKVPGPYSISGQLIEWFKGRVQGVKDSSEIT